MFVEEHYLPYAKEQNRPSTYNGYYKMWGAYLKNRMKMPLRDFRTVDCEALLRLVVRKRDLSTRTLAHIKHLLSGIFRYALRIGFLNGANPARTLVAVAGFTGLRRGELRGLEIGDYKAGVLTVQRSIWRKSVGEPKGKRGKGAVPVIPWLEKILELYLLTMKPQRYLFEGLLGGPINLEHIVGSTIAPALKGQEVRWRGWHAFRRGLATNLHQLGVADIVIQAILRHSNVAVTRDAYIIRDAVDSQSLAAMEALEKRLCNYHATEVAGREDQSS